MTTAGFVHTSRFAVNHVCASPGAGPESRGDLKRNYIDPPRRDSTFWLYYLFMTSGSLTSGHSILAIAT
jgi:hypothetical protein